MHLGRIWGEHRWRGTTVLDSLRYFCSVGEFVQLFRAGIVKSQDILDRWVSGSLGNFGLSPGCKTACTAASLEQWLVLYSGGMDMGNPGLRFVQAWRYEYICVELAAEDERTRRFREARWACTLALHYANQFVVAPPSRAASMWLSVNS